MPDLFPVTDIDRKIYREQISPFLPAKIIDIHTHIWVNPPGAPKKAVRQRVVAWPALVAAHNPIEDLRETYRLMFPDKEVVPLMFGHTMYRSEDFAAGNGYVAEQVRRFGYHGLLYARPDWNRDELLAQLRSGPFLGIKVYLSLSDPSLKPNEITIFDFLPHHQLEVMNELGMIVMLHIPRDGRLRDPRNLEQMLEIEQRYTNLHLIIAHVGRAYSKEDMGDAFNILGRSTTRMLFDFSANTNADVFCELIRHIGHRRIFFGSDLPIVRMRMHRITENGNYVNLVPQGLYGDVSGDSHMREIDDARASALTFFLYEEILSFLEASKRTGLSAQDIADVFQGNSERLLKSVTPLGR